MRDLFKLTIEVGAGPLMRGPSDIARVLHAVARRVDVGETDGTILETDGFSVVVLNAVRGSAAVVGNFKLESPAEQQEQH